MQASAPSAIAARSHFVIEHSESGWTITVRRGGRISTIEAGSSRGEAMQAAGALTEQGLAGFVAA